jgi:uncharacterized protein YyaL (SSP411 family)
MAGSPQAAGQALRVLHRFLKPSREMVLMLPESKPSERENYANELRRRFDPFSIQLVNTGSPANELLGLCPLFSGRKAIDGQSTLYVCEDAVCQQPLVASELTDFLGE